MESVNGMPKSILYTTSDDKKQPQTYISPSTPQKVQGLFETRQNLRREAPESHGDEVPPPLKHEKVTAV